MVRWSRSWYGVSRSRWRRVRTRTSTVSTSEPAGVCRVRYDNERGKGDHRHVDGIEQPYRFVSLMRLLDDFERDVEKWR